MRHGWVVAVVPLLLAAAPAAEELTGSVEDGREIALETCARCHVVAEQQRPPNPPVAEVPSFRDLADDPKVTEFYLRSFFRTSHRVMPNFMLSPRETDDIIAYIFSLKED